MYIYHMGFGSIHTQTNINMAHTHHINMAHTQTNINMAHTQTNINMAHTQTNINMARSWLSTYAQPCIFTDIVQCEWTKKESLKTTDSCFGLGLAAPGVDQHVHVLLG